jgi:hypothetical protein
MFPEAFHARLLFLTAEQWASMKSLNYIITQKQLQPTMSATFHPVTPVSLHSTVNHPFSHSFISPSFDLVIHPQIYQLIYFLIHHFIHLFAYSFMNSYIHLFICPAIHNRFIHVFIHNHPHIHSLFQRSIYENILCTNMQKNIKTWKTNSGS